MTEVYKTRWQFIERYVRGKRVLDVGPAELMGTVHRHKLSESIHERICGLAREVVGLDKSMEQVQALLKLGYDIREGDAEGFELGEQFDVIVAGELIEHLSNPGAFLECARRHLGSDGVLVLTTPNRFGLIRFLSALRRNSIPSYNKPIAKHVAFYDDNCLRDLLRRHGFSDFTVAYYEWVGRPSGSFKIGILNALLRRFRPRFLAGLMIAARPESEIAL
jgi:SAM-dependent methyltransferase